MATKSTKSTTRTTSALEAAARLNNTEVKQKEKKAQTLAQQYKEEDKVVVMGAPMYRAHFGNVMLIDLNGIPVYVPLDGNRYKIPKSYARVFNERIRTVNEEIEMRRRSSDVQNNKEQFPGELELVRRV